MKNFYIHSNGQKVKFAVACPEQINDLRKYSMYSQAYFKKEREKMHKIVIEADIVHAKVINRNGFVGA